ncbi:MAG: hypothetical protein ACTHKT_12645 [Solirubrobacterales bacterium]
MKDRAGDRRIDAALDAQPSGASGKTKGDETRDQVRQRRVRRVEGRTKRYLATLPKVSRKD